LEAKSRISQYNQNQHFRQWANDCGKGFNGVELVEVIHQVQQGHTWIDPAIAFTPG
jgi:hypothetical protein